MPRDRRRAQSAPKGSDRQSKNLASRPRVLILCEGTKTEPNYFRGLLQTYKLVNVVVIEGHPSDPKTMVDDAKKRKGYEQVWCVFDRDAWLASDFDNAISACDGERLHAAWSNEAFELWYVLHFQYLHTATAGTGGTVRSYYQDRLKSSDCLGEYAKNAEDMWEKLRPRLETATRNARKLWDERDQTAPSHQQVPVTRVVHLVEALQKMSRFE
jgi:hypothetical protein